jgi:hypothetical protein
MWQRKAVQTSYLAPHEIRSKLAHDRNRILGYDSPRHLANTFFGVDATGLGAVAAVRHVIVSSIYHVYQRINGDTPLKFAREMESKNADREREGILKLANYRFARTNPIYAKRWDLIANDRAADATVQAAAIRAMNHSRDGAHKQSFVDAMDDADEAVRLEAAKALANVPDEKAVPKLIAHLQKDDDKDVRIACADALREYKTAEVARALVSVLPDRDFGVAFRARESLLLMTGRNFRFDEAKWLDYFARTEKPFI